MPGHKFTSIKEIKMPQILLTLMCLTAFNAPYVLDDGYIIDNFIGI